MAYGNGLCFCFWSDHCNRAAANTLPIVWAGPRSYGKCKTSPGSTDEPFISWTRDESAQGPRAARDLLSRARLGFVSAVAFVSASRPSAAPTTDNKQRHMARKKRRTVDSLLFHYLPIESFPTQTSAYDVLCVYDTYNPSAPNSVKTISPRITSFKRKDSFLQNQTSHLKIF